MNPHPRLTGAALEESTAVSAADQSRSDWGPELFAYLLGAGADGPLAEWQLDSALEQPDTRARLHAIHDLARLFAKPSSGRAWVRTRNAELGARPADVIRGGTEDDLQRIRELAERQIRKA
jgi:hypothetical protein